MGENVTSKLLSGSHDFRDSRAVEEELGEKRMIRVGECEDQVTEDWHRDSLVDGEVTRFSQAGARELHPTSMC